MGNKVSLPTGRELVEAAPTVPAQACLGVIHAGFWYVIVQHVFPPIVKRILNSLESKDKLLKLNADMFKKILKFDLGDDPDFILEEVAKLQGAIWQHGVGGMLCLPSILGWGSPTLAGALARHGGLCEVGWEAQDTVCRACDRAFGGELGLLRNPPGLLAAFALHHSAAQSLVLPLNIRYPDNVYYHEGIFLLQGAAFSAFMLQQYGFTLDVTSPAGLRQMRVVIAVSAGGLWWSRLIRYSYVWGMLLRQFYRDGDTLALKLAVAPLVGMSLFNVAILSDASNKFMKFMFMKPGDSAEDANDKTVEALSAAAGHLPTFFLTKSRKEWAKVRGALHMGVLRRPGPDVIQGQ